MISKIGESIFLMGEIGAFDLFAKDSFFYADACFGAICKQWEIAQESKNKNSYSTM